MISAVVLTQAGGQLIPDAFRWLREAGGGRFDAVIVDMSDPDATATAVIDRVLRAGAAGTPAGRASGAYEGGQEVDDLLLPG